MSWPSTRARAAQFFSLLSFSPFIFIFPLPHPMRHSTGSLRSPFLVLFRISPSVRSTGHSAGSLL